MTMLRVEDRWSEGWLPLGIVHYLSDELDALLRSVMYLPQKRSPGYMPVIISM